MQSLSGYSTRPDVQQPFSLKSSSGSSNSRSFSAAVAAGVAAVVSVPGVAVAVVKGGVAGVVDLGLCKARWPEAVSAPEKFVADIWCNHSMHEVLGQCVQKHGQAFFICSCRGIDASLLELL